MIAAKDTGREQVGSLSGITHQMGIHKDAVAHIMDTLSKQLYSDPKKAIIREYSTNGRDAHVEAGCRNRAIEVSLPTDFKPVLAFRDYGTGLSEEEIGEIYSQYGASTKRSSNEFNGMLGLGCKSAFSYANQFTVVSVKDGTRIEVAVTRESDGTGGMIVVDQRATDEPNGTLVQIPTKRGDTFEDEAQQFYKWWDEGTVKVRRGGASVLIEHFDKTDEKNLDLGDGIYVVKHEYDYYRGRSGNEDYVIMGGVAYPHKFSTGLDSSYHTLVVFAPMGAVSFMSSREALNLDAQTKQFIATTEQAFKTALIRTVQAKIDGAPSHPEAAKVVADWKSLVPANVQPPGGYEYKGQPIPVSVHPHADDQHMIRRAPLKRSGYHNSHSKLYNGLVLEQIVDALFVHGYTVEKFTSSHAQKLRKYAAENNLDVPNGFILLGKIPDDIAPWLEHTIDWETIKAVKLPRDPAIRLAAGLSGRIPGSYDLYTTNRVIGASQSDRRSGVPADTFKAWKEPLFYYTGNVREGRYMWEALSATRSDATLVCMSSTRVDKFRRNFPNAAHAYRAVKDDYEVWSKQVVNDDLLALAIQRDWDTRDLKEYDPGKVDDPALKRYIQLSKQDASKTEDQNRVFQTVLGRGQTLPDVDDFSDLYPLMETNYTEHTYFYVNAVYAARQNGDTL